MQSRRHVESRIECGNHVPLDAAAHDPAPICDSDHHGVRTGSSRLYEAHVWKVECRFAIRAPILSEAPMRPPNPQASRGFDSQIIRRIAEIEEKRRAPWSDLGG